MAAAIPAAAPGAPKRRSFDRSIVEGPIAARGLEARLADGAAERDRRRCRASSITRWSATTSATPATPRSASAGRSSSSSSSSSARCSPAWACSSRAFAGANEPDKVNRVVYQAFLTAVVLSLGVLAPLGYVALADAARRSSTRRPRCAPRRCRSCGRCSSCSIGLLMFFMLGGALRAAGDARTPLRLGIAMTVLNVVFNVVFIRGARADPGVRHARRGDGHGHRERSRSRLSASGCSAPAGSSCTSTRTMSLAAGSGRSSARSSGSACRPACRAWR